VRIPEYGAASTSDFVMAMVVDAFLNAVRGAKAPERFTNKFLTIC